MEVSIVVWVSCGGTAVGEPGAGPDPVWGVRGRVPQTAAAVLRASMRVEASDTESSSGRETP